VKDVRTPRNCCENRSLIGNVALNQSNRTRKRVTAAGREVVDCANLCATGQKRLAYVATDEPSGTCHKNTRSRESARQRNVRAGQAGIRFVCHEIRVYRRSAANPRFGAPTRLKFGA
jgi:hypothetical protein